MHFEKDGDPVSLLLDIVKAARPHSGFNLAAAFAEVLEDFGISDKVDQSVLVTRKLTFHIRRYSASHATMRVITIPWLSN